MEVDSGRNPRVSPDESTTTPSVPVTESEATAGTPQHDVPTVRVICDPGGGLQLDHSKRGPEYSRRIARKLARSKVPSDTWNNYSCRKGAVIQFVSDEGTSIGKTQPLTNIQVNLTGDQTKNQRILVRKPEGPDGRKILLPTATPDPTNLSEVSGQSADTTSAAPSDTADVPLLGSKPLANWSRMKTKPSANQSGKPASAKPLPDAATSAASAIPFSSRATGEQPSWAFDRTKNKNTKLAAGSWGIRQAQTDKIEWQWMTPSRAAETQLRTLLKERNGELHINRRRLNEKRKKMREQPLEGPTWIEGFLNIAKQKFGDIENPVCRLAEVYLRPDYLSAPHPDQKAATKAVDHVVGLLITARKSGNSALQKFASELLDRGQYKDLEQVGVAGATRKDLTQLSKKLSDPRTSLSDGLHIILQQLGDSIRHEYDQMRRNGNEGEKIESIDKCRQTLSQAGRSKAFRNCTAEQREELKGVINGWDDRLVTYVNTNQLPPKGN